MIGYWEHKCFVKIKYNPEISGILCYIFCFTCKPYNASNPEEEPVEIYQTPFFDYAMYKAIKHFQETP